MLKMIFVRHGFSQANAEKRYAGIYDAPLTEEGRLQARSAAEYLKSFPVDAIYSSDITRAVDTARPISQALNLPIVTEPLLRELSGGEWEGITMAERAEKYPELAEKWENRIYECRCPGGESIEELCERACRAMEKIRALHPEGCVVIVSHGIFIRAALGICRAGCIQGVQEIPWMKNASISIVEWDGDSKNITVFNSDDHLTGI